MEFLSTNIISILGLRFASKPNIEDIATRNRDLSVCEESGALDALSYGRLVEGRERRTSDLRETEIL